MTARVTTLKGVDAGAYYVDGPGRYYLDGGEPPGRWLGRGAEALGLAGEVDDDHFLAAMDGRNPIDGELLGTRHTDKTVRGFDVTCSAPKSVSVLFAIGDDRTRKEVLDAHDAAVAAALGWIEDHAHCRYRFDREIWTVDADGVIAAAFRQHTSRAHDPQIHTHLVIANRVMAPDGRWLALDARTLKCDQRTVSALYAAGLRAELTARLGARWKPVENGLAEMSDAPDEVLAAFSERTRQMARRRDEKVERFVDTVGRRPTPRESWAIDREAARDSRPTKTSVDAATLHEHWRDQLNDLGFTSDQYVDRVAGRTRPVSLDGELGRAALVDAVSSLRDTQSVWRPAEITREVAAALPTRLAATASEVVERVQRLASHAEDTLVVDISRPVPDGVPLRDDGRPVIEGAVDRMLTTDAILDEEERILELVQHWHDEGGADERELAPDDDLTAVQQHAAGAVAGERRIVLVVGPAGTGKTTAMRPAVAHLHDQGRSCFGVAPSAAAAEVLAVDTGIDADTVDKLLIEHRLDRPPQHRYDLPHGSTVVVDEAAMVSTQRLAELIELAEAHGWRLALIGDPMQFSAVGRSGMFGHLVDTIGAVELDRVHRFDASWERDASLRLRRGATDVVALYDDLGRLHGGTSRQMALATVHAWRRAIEAGGTAAMMAPTREAVATLNEIAQKLRFAAGEIDPKGDSVRVGASRAHVGDLVATRRNDRTLRTDQERMVKNRDHWSIEAVHRNGALTVAGQTGRVTLPTDYVATDVELAYAETSHATQGRTVDRSFLYLDGPTDTSGIYVPLTRGRTSNEAFVVLHDERTAAEVVADAVARTWVDQPATALRLDQELPSAARRPGGPARAPLTALPKAELCDLVSKAVAHQMESARLHYALEGHSRELGDLARRQRETTEAVAAAKVRLTGATRILDEHDRPLRRRSHRIAIARAKADLRSLPRQIDGLEDELVRLATTAETERAAKDRTAQRGSVRGDSSRVAETFDHDARIRGEQAAQQPTHLLTTNLGPVPEDQAERVRWIAAAGRVAQHHALWSIREEQLLGPRPRAMGQDDYAFTHYAVQRAIADLDQPLGIRQEAPGRVVQGPSL